MSLLVSIIILGKTIPIRIHQYPFVKDELIVFVGGLGTKFILFGFADDFRCLTNARFTWCLQRMLEFVRVCSRCFDATPHNLWFSCDVIKTKK